MTWGALASHVADVGAPGVPYIGEGGWGGSSASLRSSSRWSVPWRRWSRSREVGAGRGAPRRRPAPLLRTGRGSRSWPRWTSLRGRRWSNPKYVDPKKI